MARPFCLAQCMLTLLLLFHPVSATPEQLVLDHASTDLYRTLRFDDLPTSLKSGIGNLSTYSHLTFSSFTLINAPAAASAGLISAADVNCAASSPNALMASRHANPSLWPRIVLDPATAHSHQLSPFFNFVGFSRKPMNYTPLYTTVTVSAYGILPNRTVLTHYTLVSTYLTAGYQPSFPLNITQYFPTWGRGVNMVEIYSQTPAGEDWDFCVDDLLVEFVAAKEGEDGGGTGLGPEGPVSMHVRVDVLE